MPRPRPWRRPVTGRLGGDDGSRHRCGMEELVPVLLDLWYPSPACRRYDGCRGGGPSASWPLRFLLQPDGVFQSRCGPYPMCWRSPVSPLRLSRLSTHRPPPVIEQVSPFCSASTADPKIRARLVPLVHTTRLTPNTDYYPASEPPSPQSHSPEAMSGNSHRQLTPWHVSLRSLPRAKGNSLSIPAAIITILLGLRSNTLVVVCIPPGRVSSCCSSLLLF